MAFINIIDETLFSHHFACKVKEGRKGVATETPSFIHFYKKCNTPRGTLGVTYYKVILHIKERTLLCMMIPL